MAAAVNSKTGMIYNVIPAPGGAWHIYSDGRKVFVRSSAPAVAPVAPEVPAQAAGPSVEESAYWTGQSQISDAQQAREVAQATFEKGQNLQANDRAGQSNLQDYQEALRQMGIAQPREEQNARVAANKQNLFYSSTLGNQLSDVAASYVDKRAAAQRGFDRAEAERAAARHSIEAGYGVTGQGQAESAVGRNITQDTATADAGGLAPPPVAAPSTPLTKVPRMLAAQPFKTVVKRGNVYHYTPGRKPVYVRKASR